MPPGTPRVPAPPSEARELLPSAKLAALLEEVAPGELLDADVEAFLQEHVDEFVEGVTEMACRLARHRKSRTLEARDVQLFLEKNWGIRVPGYGDDPRVARRVPQAGAREVHAARLAAIAKVQQSKES
jgi:transcription initiation factor TFIID subunit 12